MRSVSAFSRVLGTLVGTTLLLTAACRDTPAPTGLEDPRPALQISDGAHDSGNAHFYFLPPLVARPTTTGVFDGTLSPAVSICEWNGAECTGAALAEFTSGPEGIRVVPEDELYLVHWQTDRFPLVASQVYRIRVLVSGTELGHADVYVAASSKALRGVDRNEFIPLLDGRTMPIKFRIERGAVPAAPALLTGVVRDRVTNSPIPGVRLFFYGSAYGSAETDATGRYSFTANDLQSFGGPIQGNLFAGKAGYFEPAPASVPDLSSQSLPLINDITLLPSDVIVRGTVRDAASGSGIGAATIRLARNPMSTYRGGASEETLQAAPDGSYEIDASYFNESALSTGFAISLGITATGYLGTNAAESFTSYPLVRDFRLTSAAGPLITGVVRDRTTGLALAGAQIFFYGSAVGSVETDADGRYAFTEADLRSFGGGISGNLFVGKTGFFEAAPIAVGDLSQESSLPVVHDVTLLGGGTLIHGVVRDAATATGIGGASILLSRNPMSTFRGGASQETVQTSADGSYQIDASYFNEVGVTSGFTATLQVNAPNYLGSSSSLTFTGYPVVQDFRLVPANGPLMTGIVRDRSTNQPIPGAQVFFYGSAYGTVQTDADGRYTFMSGDLQTFGGAIGGTLFIGSGGYFETAPIAIADLGTEPSLPVVHDATLLPGGAVQRGVVQDAGTGQGIPGVRILFSRFPMSTYRGGYSQESVTTASDGSYEIDASYFNESGVLGGFTISADVNADGYLGTSQVTSFSVYPFTQDFDLQPVTPALVSRTSVR